MIDAIDAGRPHRASGQLGRHVVGVARGILRGRRHLGHGRDRGGVSISPRRFRFRFGGVGRVVTAGPIAERGGLARE